MVCLPRSRNGKALGDPVPAMVRRVKKWCLDGYDVRVFTVRAADASQCALIGAWLKQHDLPALPITNVKAAGLLELWDDRAIRVRRNRGQPCSGCAGESRLSFHDSLTDC